MKKRIIICLFITLFILSINVTALATVELKIGKRISDDGYQSFKNTYLKLGKSSATKLLGSIFSQIAKNNEQISEELPYKPSSIIENLTVKNQRIEEDTRECWANSFTSAFEGEIEGYAKELKDTIPEGFVFNEEDNKEYNWKAISERIVRTDYLQNTLLQPGESATVQLVLRWKNSEENLGQKVNVAEISKYENPYGAPDIDAKLGNSDEGEADQHSAIVLVSLITGSKETYFVIGIIIVAIMGAGAYSIKKFVL